MIKTNQYSRTIISSIVSSIADIYSNMNFTGYTTNILIVSGGLTTLCFAVYEIYKSNKEEAEFKSELKKQDLITRWLLYEQINFERKDEKGFIRYRDLLYKFTVYEIKEITKNKNIEFDFETETYEAITSIMDEFTKVFERGKFTSAQTSQPY